MTMVFFNYFFSALRAISLKEGNKIDIEIFQCFVFILLYKSITMLLSGVKILSVTNLYWFMIVIMIHNSCNKAVQIGGYIDNIHKSNTESFQTYIFIVRFNHNVRMQTKPCPFSSPHGSYTIHTAISVLRLSKQPWTINIIDNDKTKHISINNGNKYMKKKPT